MPRLQCASPRLAALFIAACKPAKAKDETADLIKKLIGALQGTQANNPKAKPKPKVQEWDPDSDDEEDESDEE